MPVCSIVISTFNHARYLSRSIESALSQTHPRTEVVVVDDASSDDSREVIRGFGNRVIAVLTEQSCGQAAAVNAGFRASHGDIVLFLDADDYLYSDALVQVASAWAPGISKVQFRLDQVDAGGSKVYFFPAPEVRFDSGDVIPQLLSKGRYETTVTSGNAFTRGVLDRILPVPESAFRVSADGYLVTVAPLFGPVVSIEEPLGAYRRHPDNLWARTDCSTLRKQLRRSLGHDKDKYRSLVEKAGELGLEVAPCPGMRDHHHLTTRIASLCLDPVRHPYPGDSRRVLALAGARASCDARLPWKRRLLLAAWFLVVGFLPGLLVRRAVVWRLAQEARTPPVDRFLKALRRMAR